MSQQAHTPGPWFAFQGILADQPTVWDVTDGKPLLGSDSLCPKGSFIAAVHEVSDAQSAEINARLIAAAPDMLAALKAQVRVTRKLAEKLGYSPEDADDMTGQARAAIAKATGGQS